MIDSNFCKQSENTGTKRQIKIHLLRFRSGASRGQVPLKYFWDKTKFSKGQGQIKESLRGTSLKLDCLLKLQSVLSSIERTEKIFLNLGSQALFLISQSVVYTYDRLVKIQFNAFKRLTLRWSWSFFVSESSFNLAFIMINAVITVTSISKIT